MIGSKIPFMIKKGERKIKIIRIELIDYMAVNLKRKSILWDALAF